MPEHMCVDLIKINVMKKLLLIPAALMLVFACKKEKIEPVEKSTSTVKMVRNGFHYHYFHNGSSVDTNVFEAQSGDSVRLVSMMSVPMNHYAHIIVNNDTVVSHIGFQDTCNLMYVIP